MQLNIDEIVIKPDRQRKDVGDVSDLVESIKRIGLLNPIIVTAAKELVCGERRLTAAKELGWDSIPVNFKEDLADIDLQLVELDENVRRRDLTWQETAESLYTMHKILLTVKGDSWGVKNTAEEIGYSYSYMRRMIEVQTAIANGNTKLSTFDSINSAGNQLTRENERKLDNDLNKVTETLLSGSSKADKTEEESSLAASYKPTTSVEFINTDFLKFAEAYNGNPYNFIHCDFPYGINHDKSDQGNSEVHGAYSDSEEVYWELCASLCRNRNKLMYPSAHIMFWFSMKFYSETIEFFSRNAPDIEINPVPLVWFKSCNTGIVSDVKRRPRNVMEFCLMMSRGDRKIIQPVANCYPAPMQKKYHVSEKSESMLRHFYRMFIDEHSEVLDPTCGSGSAARAAITSKPKRITCLELNPEYAEIARNAFEENNRKNKLSKMLGVQDD